MLSPPCESVQICKDPDRYSRIHQKLDSRENSFEIEIVKSATKGKHVT